MEQQFSLKVMNQVKQHTQCSQFTQTQEEMTISRSSKATCQLQCQHFNKMIIKRTCFFFLAENEKKILFH